MDGRARVLFVDDDSTLVRSVSRSLRAHFDVTATTDPRQALALCTESRFDALLTDLEMPGLDGRQLIRAVLARLSDPPAIVVLTGTSAVEVQGALAVVRKPASLEELVDALHAAMATRRRSELAI